MSDSFLSVPIRSDKLSLSIKISEHVSHRQTPFQTIDIYDTEAFGRILTLDGHIQLTELDEGVYHEYLVHVPLLSVAKPRSALVVGGGDGGVLRELCKYPSIERIDIAEIDEGVIEESRKYLPFVSAGAFADPRVHVRIGDAFVFTQETREKYDLIVVDSTDVYEEEDGGLSEALFTEGFYKTCLGLLGPEGVVVTQADNPVFCPYSLENILRMFGSVFPLSGSYKAVIPSFGGVSAYCWGSASTRLGGDFRSDRAAGLHLGSLDQAGYRYAFRP